jgi:hypothetical protein
VKPLQIFVVGATATILVFFLEFFIGWVALGIAVLPAVLVLAGHVFIPAKAGGMSVSMNPDLFLFDDVPAELPVTISGAQVILGPLMKHIQFRIERRNFWLLGLVAVMSLALVAWVWQDHDRIGIPGETINRGWIVYYGVSVWLVVISLSWRWCLERLLLRNCRLRLVPVEPIGNGLFHLPRVRYSFTADDGEYYGNTVQHFSHKFNSLELVFYSPTHPQYNLHASGLLFHKVVWQ